MKDTNTKINNTITENDKLNLAMFDASPYINIIFDDKLNLVGCNPKAISYFGFSSKQELLDNLYELIEASIPEFQPDGSISTSLSKRFEYVIENGSIEFEVEMVLNGNRVPLRFELKKIPYEDSFAIVGYIIDMASLKEARNELLRRDKLMRQVNRAAGKLMNADPDNFDKTIVSVLRTLARSVDAKRMYIWENFKKDEDLYCKELYIWEEDGNPHPEKEKKEFAYTQVPHWYTEFKANRSIRIDIKEEASNIDTLYYQRNSKVAIFIPIFFQDEFWGFVGLEKAINDIPFSDMQEKILQNGGILTVSAILRNQINLNLIEAREAALASDKAKSEFLSRMSHEIRTPMNAIVGMTAIAKKSMDVKDMQYSLDKIESASAQLIQIINDILDMSKIESGKIEINPIPFDLQSEMHDIFNMMKVKFDEKEQNFTYDFKGNYDRYVICDDLRLSQVIINLLTNAIKFTPVAGNISISTSYFQKDSEIYSLHVEVKDDGIGIAEEQQQRLFNTFEQADGSITRRFGGSGLGLTICKNITNLMGGDIWIKSKKDEGSNFIFEVDFKWGDKIEKSKESNNKVATGYDWEGKNILIVEDVDINREIVKTLLEDTGINADEAENGLKAIDAIKMNPGKYDLILMDLQMPELDGFETTLRIRALDSLKDKNIPIIAMTANAFVEDIDKCIATGMNDHIAKPIDIDKLMEKLQIYLSKS